MEEYRQIRARRSFMDMCKTPELAVEVTLQPVRRFDLDAAIIFSDILLPLEQMGVPPLLRRRSKPGDRQPVRSRQDVERLKPLDVEKDLSYVLQAIERARTELDGTVPLIGFSGAPFTLASYLIEGGGSKYYEAAKTLMHTEAAVFRLLMDKLTDMAMEYLNAQARHGAQAVQVFDSWVGILSTQDYREHVLPHMKRLFASLDRSYPEHTLRCRTLFTFFLSCAKAGGDVIGVDWRVPIDEAWACSGKAPRSRATSTLRRFSAPPTLSAAGERHHRPDQGGQRPYLQPRPWHPSRHTGRERRLPHRMRPFREEVPLKTVVLLVNFGGPRSAEDVPWFLKQMTGRDAPQAISAISDRYRAIGGTSPLAAITDEQAVLLAGKMGNRFPILSAYRYSPPSLAERIDEARRTGFEHLVFFVMSPYAAPTTGNYVTAVEACLEEGRCRQGQSYRPVVTFVHGWYKEPAFIDCWVSG